MAKSFVIVPEIAKLLHARGLIPNPNNVARIVIDIKPHELPRIYVEAFGNESLLEVVGLLAGNPGSVDVRVGAGFGQPAEGDACPYPVADSLPETLGGQRVTWERM